MSDSVPVIPFLAGWEKAATLIDEEVRQLREEGRDPKWIEALLNETRGRIPAADLWPRLQSAPILADFAFVEPSGLDEIRAERPEAASRRYALNYSDDQLRDRMHGAWLGRCCGCALGKPVECLMDTAGGFTSRERIRRYLQGCGPNAYPLNDYFTAQGADPALADKLDCPLSQRERIAFMESDDDIRYTVLGQCVLREKGAAFTTADVMRAWLTRLHYPQVCTAETQAFRNFVIRYYNRPLSSSEDREIDWSWVATHQNPYREWIGAQIRADSWGYAAPGRPELAAEFAWRDARLSHVKNGIYGEMFIAAMIAAGFALDDPLAVVRAGLAEVPRHSRLARDIEQTVELCRGHDFRPDAFEQVLDGLYALFSHYHPVHTINNAALVVVALLLGGRDFEKVITIAVMGGWDTDCNGATAGSIFGAMHGVRAIPAKWSDPLNDRLFAEIFDYQPIAISECARRSFEIAKLAEEAND